VLARLLEETVGQHESRPAPAGDAGGDAAAPNMFCGLRAPAIPLTSYLQRIFKYANCSPACYVLAFIYLERLLAVRGAAHAQTQPRASSPRERPPLRACPPAFRCACAPAAAARAPLCCVCARARRPARRRR
jgi:hypothetical protein